ncbi:Oidioi.mRNA.OKI2018_I69.XSR.g16025.t1.cds [Oikopleura dioica]|uniref:Oidioi.mRNA.OKI2018_I69.XSR.g16025.t1.cds n=1 Tax=Oikopleura dioica TaxID=34765 RepID=A0ABN7SER1_OIKDI|nr:Oidioi.mRNA.OKI2018_I69.XSR.g16025.t1.cds [Oikopleura dioica]
MALYDSRELQVFQLESAADTRSLCELRADLLLTGDYGGGLNLYQRTLTPNVEGFQPLLYSKKVSQPIVQLEWTDEREFEEHCIMLCPNMISLINVLLPRNKESNEYDVKTIFELHTKEDLYSFSWKLAERPNHLHTFAMTLSGKLLVSRGERVLYTVQVSSANMPSSLIFIESMDKIVVQGEAMTLCSYDQNQLAMTSDELGRKVAPSMDWIYFGIENILEVVTIDTKHASLVFALGTSKVSVINGADGALIRSVSKEGVRITAMNIYETRKGSQLKIGNSKVKSENRMTREELDREIGKIERCLDDSEAPKTSHEPPKARMEMVPSPGQRSGEIQLSFQISLPGNIHSICVDVVPVDPNLGSVEIYTDNLEDEVFFEGTVQVYFGKLTLNYTPFLSPGLIATASYIHAGTEVSSTVSKLCALPLDLICAKSSLSEVSPGFSEVTLFVEKPQHLTYLEHSQEKSFSFTSDSFCKVSLNNSTMHIIGDSVSTLVSLNSLIEQNLSPKFLKMIHISESLLNERLNEIIQNINTMCNKWKELNRHLEQNVKFLTSIQRTIMIKAKSTVEEKSISKLVELCRKTSNEITRHRSEIQNIERKLERSRTFFFADVQLAVLTRLVNEGADSRVICELRDIFCSSASSNDMLLQIESDLNSLSIIVGLKPSESYQGDPAKILKKTSQIISKVSTDTVQSLLKRL